MENTAMNRATVARELRDEVARHMDREDIECRIITKINDTFRYALIIGEKDGDARPTIYIDSYINSVIKSGHDVKWVARCLTEVVEDVCRYDSASNAGRENTEMLEEITKESIFEKAFFEIVDPVWNKEYLKDKVTLVPECCPDMALIARVQLDDNRSFVFGEALLKKYEIDKAELLYRAWTNTVHKPMKVGPLGEVLKEMGEPGHEDETEEMDDTTLVLSYGQFGAAAMACGIQTLHRISVRFDDDLYILPSSIHEILTMPASMVSSSQDLATMVREVNRCNVPREEQLSDSVFLYEREANTIKRC